MLSHNGNEFKLSWALFLVLITLAACSSNEPPQPAPASGLTPPSPVPIPLTLVPQPASTSIPDLQVPIVAPILPEAVGTPVTTPVPVPPIEVQSPLLEAPDLTSNIFVEYILDASGSMMGQLADHTRKRDVAQKVFIARLGSFPPQIHIGFRAFGHSMDWRGREDASCQDIALIAPVQTGQLETIAAWLSAFTAQGMTPLAQAIRYAVEDLPKADGVNNAIVLISDGEETCGGDPCAVVNQLRAAGVHFTLHVVGMNVRPGDAEQLLCVARAGQGFYKPVQTAQELNRALEEVERHIAAGNAPVVAQLSTPAPTSIPPTATPVPPTPAPALYFSDIDSVIQGIRDSLSTHSIHFFEALPTVDDLGYTDYFEGGQPYSKWRFLSDLDLRIKSNARCDFYTVSPSGDTLMIWTSGWTPQWEITEFCYVDCWTVNPPRRSGIAAFFLAKLNDQWTLDTVWLNDPKLLFLEDSEMMPCD